MVENRFGQASLVVGLTNLKSEILYGQPYLVFGSLGRGVAKLSSQWRHFGHAML